MQIRANAGRPGGCPTRRRPSRRPEKSTVFRESSGPFQTGRTAETEASKKIGIPVRASSIYVAPWHASTPRKIRRERRKSALEWSRLPDTTLRSSKRQENAWPDDTELPAPRAELPASRLLASSARSLLPDCGGTVPETAAGEYVRSALTNTRRGHGTG